MINAFGYARLSPDDKKYELKTSLVNQRKLIKEHCKNNNKRLIHIFEDSNITGSDRYRKDFIEMLSRSMNKEAEEIIVKDSSRYCRDSAYFQDTLKDLNAYNIKVFGIIENKYLDPEDIGDIFSSVIHAQIVIIGRKKAKLLQELKIKESLPSIPAPFGYKYNKSRNHKNWVIDKEKAEIVKNVLEMIKNNKNFKEITEKNNISKNIYYKIIKNLKKYTGYVSYYKYQKDSNGKIINKNLVVYKGKHEPLIDEITYNKIKKKINLK